MRTIAVVFGLALLATATIGGDERLKIHVSNSTKLAPAEILIQAIVEPESDNAALEVIAESEDFYRSSTLSLDGTHAPRVSSVCFRQMPAGFYEVIVRVLTTNGHEVARARDALTIG